MVNKYERIASKILLDIQDECSSDFDSDVERVARFIFEDQQKLKPEILFGASTEWIFRILYPRFRSQFSKEVRKLLLDRMRGGEFGRKVRRILQHLNLWILPINSIFEQAHPTWQKEGLTEVVLRKFEKGNIHVTGTNASTCVGYLICNGDRDPLAKKLRDAYANLPIETPKQVSSRNNLLHLC